MCECGCVASDERYAFPGPGKDFYLLTLSKGCIECDAPSGVIIERIKLGMFMHKRVHREEFIDGELQFEKWSDSEGVAIVTGMLRHEFIKSLQSHLIGVSSDDFGEDGKIDESGAEVILEEMYLDAQVRPHFPEAKAVS